MRTLVGAALASFVAAFVTVAALPAPPIAVVQARKPPDVATLYRVHCQMCHGPAGKSPIPDFSFVGRTWKHGTKTAEMAKIIGEGVAGTPMLPFKSKLSDAEILALAKHVRTFDTRLKREQ